MSNGYFFPLSGGSGGGGTGGDSSIAWKPNVDADGNLSWARSNSTTTPATQNIKGEDGKSAYDIWIEAGNTGSEVDFIEFLKGENGDPGADGKSAYELWLELGNTGSEEDFLESLKGDPGDEGFSPVITENADNTDEVYKLDIETKDGQFTTPNLKGAGGVGTIDDTLDITSTNPIQNKAVAEKFDEIESLLKDEVVYWYSGQGSLSVESYKTEVKITPDMVGTDIPIIVVSPRYGESSGTVTIEAQVDENTFTISGTRDGDIAFAYEESIKSNGINDSQTSTETTWSSLHIQDVIDGTIGDIAGEIIKDSIISDDTTWSSKEIREEIENLIEDNYANSLKVYSSAKVENELEAIRDIIPEVTLDDTLDTTSENAIKNKVVAEKFEEIDEILAQGGNAGADGKSAYDIWIDEGNAGSEADFLASLKGEKGADGVMTFDDLTEEQKASLKGDKGDKGDAGTNGTTPTIKVASGSNINSVGTPSVTASTSGTTTTFTFDYLKGATGASGYKRFPSTPGVTTTTGTICSLDSKKIVVLYCISGGGGSLKLTSYPSSGVTFNGSAWTSGTKPISIGSIYTIANTSSSTTTVQIENNGGGGFLIFGPMS